MGAAICATPPVSFAMQTLPNPAEERQSFLPTPRQIIEHLDRSVVGQDRAKRTLAVAVSNHYIRLLDAMDRASETPIITDASLRQVTIEKSNVLLIGPSLDSHGGETG